MHLIHVLGLSDQGDTLSHWIAHYLAELFVAEEAATGEAKLRLGKKITETALLLWKNRKHLPHLADPMKRYSKAIDALGALNLGLQVETNWERFLPKTPMPSALKFYEKSARLGVLGVLEMIPGTAEDLPAWLPELIASNEANFMAVFADVYVRLFAERPEIKLEGAAAQKLGEVKAKLLDELQVLLDELRVA